MNGKLLIIKYLGIFDADYFPCLFFPFTIDAL